MNNSRWRSMSLEERYASLHGNPSRPEEPAAPMSLPLRHVALSEEEREKQARDLRVARALIQIETAEREQQAEAAKQRRVTVPGAIGALMRGARP